MGIVELLILSVGLATDATAVSLACSISDSGTRKRLLAKAALLFGLFQALMPLIGFALAHSFRNLIQGIDHWVAFVLLFAVGGKMVVGASKTEEESVFSDKRLLVLAVATSIDALIVGVTFSFIETNLLLDVATIGIVTFVLSLIAGLLGKTISQFDSKYLKITGGLAIIAIGLKILLNHIL